MEDLSSYELQLLGKDIVHSLSSLRESFNKIDSTSSVFFTYLSSYSQSLCDMILSRIELFKATKDLYSIVGPEGSIWDPSTLKQFSALDTQLLSADARLILTLRSGTERAQLEFASYIGSVKDQFSRRHAKLKECCLILEARDSKKPLDPVKEKKRKKKFNKKLKPFQDELQTLTDLLLVGLTELKNTYLDWFEPLIHFVAKLRMHPPAPCWDYFLNDPDLLKIKASLDEISERIDQSFLKSTSSEYSWAHLRQDMDKLISFPLSCSYFEQFAIEERVSESYSFYKDVKRFKDMFKNTNAGDEIMAKQAKQIVSKYLSEGAKLEINIPQSMKIAVVDQLDNVHVGMFDKALVAIKDMLEDTFQHFVTSKSSHPLEERLVRVAQYTRRLRSISKQAEKMPGADVLPSIERTLSKGDIPIERSQRSTSRAILQKSSSSGVIHNPTENHKLDSPSHVSSKSATSPLPPMQPIPIKEARAFSDMSLPIEAKERSPARGVRSIFSTLSQMVNSSRKKKGTEVESNDNSEDEFDMESTGTTSDEELSERKHFKLLSSNFAELINNPRASDFTIYCGPEKVPFACHSAVFAARWPVLLREYPKLLADISRGQEPSIEFETIDPEIFLLILEYVYTGRLISHVTDYQLKGITEFAKFRKIPGLKQLANSLRLSNQAIRKVVGALMTHIETNTEGGMMRLESDPVYESIVQVLAQRAQELVDVSQFQENGLHLLRRIDVIHLIRRDDFAITSESQLLNLVVKWAEMTSEDEDARMENLSFLIAHVRLPLMTLEELRWVESLGWVPKNLIEEAHRFRETGVCNHSSRSKPRKLPGLESKDVITSFSFDSSLSSHRSNQESQQLTPKVQFTLQTEFLENSCDVEETTGIPHDGIDNGDKLKVKKQRRSKKYQNSPQNSEGSRRSKSKPGKAAAEEADVDTIQVK